MEKYLEVLKNIEVWKNTEMYCTFEDQALQGYETCGQQENLLKNIDKYGNSLKNTEKY